MFQEPPANPDERSLSNEGVPVAPTGVKKPVVPLVTILICAGLSILFMNAGLLSFFYLVPLGYAIIVSGSFFYSFAVTAAAGVVFNIIKNIAGQNPGGNIMLQNMYFLIIIFSFAWIMGGSKFRTAYRFILASAAGAVISLIFINSPQVRFYEYFHEIASGIYGNSADSVLYNESLMEDRNTAGVFNMGVFSPDQMVEMAKSFILRGGALISMFFLFFVNMQIANTVFSIIKKQRRSLNLISFTAPANAIWVLSGAIATIVLSSMLKSEIIGILAWNVFTVCAVVFLAQGAGILMYWLSMRTNVFRLVINVVIVIILLSPMSLFAIAALAILGIIDIWASFRMPKTSA